MHGTWQASNAQYVWMSVNRDRDSELWVIKRTKWFDKLDCVANMAYVCMCVNICCHCGIDFGVTHIYNCTPMIRVVCDFCVATNPHTYTNAQAESACVPSKRYKGVSVCYICKQRTTQNSPNHVKKSPKQLIKFEIYTKCDFNRL